MGCGREVPVGVESVSIGKVSIPQRTVMGPSDLQRYHRLLLEKQRELSSAHDDAVARVPAAGGLDGDLIDQANADAEAELQIQLHRTEGRLLRAIEEALVRIKKRTYGVCESVRTSYFKTPLERRPLDAPLPRV